MNWKKIALIGLLVLLGIQAFVPYARAEREFVESECTNLLQAGRITMKLSEYGEWTAIQFAKKFCAPPIVVASPGENLESVRIGVISPSVVWVFTEGIKGQEVVIYWQAAGATQ